jgi:hypothetical protein
LRYFRAYFTNTHTTTASSRHALPLAGSGEPVLPVADEPPVRQRRHPRGALLVVSREEEAVEEIEKERTNENAERSSQVQTTEVRKKSREISRALFFGRIQTLAMPIYVYDEIDLSVVKVSSVVTNSQGGKAAYVNQVDDTGFRTPLKIQMCHRDMSDLQTCPYGISLPREGEQNSNRRTLDLSLGDEQKKFIEAVDAWMIKTAVENSQEWFGRTLDETSVSAMYNNVLHAPTQEGRPFIVRTKVDVNASPVVDAGKEDESKRRKTTLTNIEIVTDSERRTFRRGSVDEVTPYSKCMAIVKLGSVYFINKRQFGVSLLVTDLRVWPSRIEGESSFETDLDFKEEKEEE